MRVYQPASLAEKQASGLVRLCLKAVRCRATEDDTWGSAQTNTCTHTLECITRTKYVYFCANQSAHLPRLIHCIRGNTVQNVFPFDFSVILSVHTSFSLLTLQIKTPTFSSISPLIVPMTYRLSPSLEFLPLHTPIRDVLGSTVTPSCVLTSKDSELIASDKNMVYLSLWVWAPHSTINKFSSSTGLPIYLIFLCSLCVLHFYYPLVS